MASDRGGVGNDVFYVDSAALGGSFAVRDTEAISPLAWNPATVDALNDPVGVDDSAIQPLDGDVQGTTPSDQIERAVACFTPGTRVLTIEGEVPVEQLRSGDMVLTRDNGFQPIRWIGRRDLSADELQGCPKLNPVKIKAGAIAEGMPHRDMLVSPQHRMLINDSGAELMFGESEVLVAAVHLLGRRGFQRTRPDGVSYIHFMFDQHEIVLADGAWSESFQPTLQTLGGLGDDQRDEIFALFPELLVPNGYPAARLSLKARECKILFNF